MTKVKPEATGYYRGMLHIGDVIHYYQDVKPPWWQFWKRRKIIYRHLEVTGTHYYGKTTFYEGRFVGP